MAIQIIDTGTLSARGGVKAVVYGKPGVGKTRLIATAPSPLILSAEKGLLSLRQYRLPAIEIASMADFVEAYNFIMQSAQARQFYTIALDSISDLAEVVLAHEKKVNPNKSNGFRPYMELADQFMSLLRNLRALDRNVYYIAKEEYDKDENGMMMFQPSMPGKQLVMQVPYLVDEIFRLQVFPQPDGSLIRALQTATDNRSVAKDRSGMLAPWEPADLSYIYGKIMG